MYKPPPNLCTPIREYTRDVDQFGEEMLLLQRNAFSFHRSSLSSSHVRSRNQLLRSAAAAGDQVISGGIDDCEEAGGESSHVALHHVLSSVTVTSSLLSNATFCSQQWLEEDDSGGRPEAFDWDHPSPVRKALMETDPGLNQSLISSATTISQLFDQNKCRFLTECSISHILQQR